MKTIEEIFIDRLASMAIAWMQRYNEILPPGELGVIVPNPQDLITEVFVQAAQNVENQDVDN